MKNVILMLLGGLIDVAGTLVGKVLIALGIGFISYEGVSSLLDFAEASIKSNILSMPVEVTQILHTTKVDVAVSILTSAVVARLTLQGLTAGGLRRMVRK
jgi:hypothetical protein